MQTHPNCVLHVYFKGCILCAYYILKGVLIGLCIRIKIGDPIGAIERHSARRLLRAHGGIGYSIPGIFRSSNGTLGHAGYGWLD